MPLGLKQRSKQVEEPKKVAKSKKSDDDADEAKALLEQMQAKEDNGDCAFC